MRAIKIGLSLRKRRRLLLGVVLSMVTTGLAVWLTQVAPVWLSPFEYRASGLLGFLVLFALQLVGGLLAWMVITVSVSGTGSIGRWFARRWGLGNDQWKWRWISAEGLIVGLAMVGAWLGWSTTDVYPHPEEDRRIEIRQPSLLEGPLGIHSCSDVFVPVTVIYRDARGLTVVQQGCEDKQSEPATRIMGRRILWSTGGLRRAVVILPETGIHLFFPEPINHDYCPPEAAIEAYLRGEPVETVERTCRAKTAQND